MIIVFVSRSSAKVFGAAPITLSVPWAVVIATGVLVEASAAAGAVSAVLDWQKHES